MVGSLLDGGPHLFYRINGLLQDPNDITAALPGGQIAAASPMAAPGWSPAATMPSGAATLLPQQDRNAP